MIEEDEGYFIADQPYNFNKGKKYHLTMVLLFKKDTSDYKAEINKNTAKLESLSKTFINKTGDFKK